MYDVAIGKNQGKNKNNGIKFSATMAYEISPSTPVIIGGDPEICINEAKCFGYDAVEIHIKNPCDVDAKKVTAVCEKSGMKVSAIATGRSYVIDRLSLIDDNESMREIAIARVKEYIDLACIIGGSVIIGCMRGNIPDMALLSLYENRLSQSMKKAAEYAQHKGVTLLLEAINRYENNYLNTAGDTADFIRKYAIPATKILLDTFHMNIEEKNIYESIMECGDLFGYLHVADSNRKYPGAGHVDFKGIMNTLKEIGYDSYVSTECLPLPDSATAAEKGLKYLKALV